MLPSFNDEDDRASFQMTRIAYRPFRSVLSCLQISLVVLPGTPSQRLNDAIADTSCLPMPEPRHYNDDDKVTKLACEPNSARTFRVRPNKTSTDTKHA